MPGRRPFQYVSTSRITLLSLTKVQPRRDLRPRLDAPKCKLSSSMATKPLTDLPVETLRDIVAYVDRVDVICLALTSHHLLGIVLAVKGVSKLRELCPERPSIPQGSCMTLPWLGQKRIEPLYDYEECYGDYEILMSRLYNWMGPTYIYCGRWDKSYIKRGGPRHVDSDINCFCGWSESRRWIDVANDILSCSPIQYDELDRALAASEEARKDAEACFRRIMKLKTNDKERLARPRAGHQV